MFTPSVRRRLSPALELRVVEELEGAERGSSLGLDLRQVLARARCFPATDEQIALALGIAVALAGGRGQRP